MRESLQTKSFMIDVKVQDIVPLAEPMEAIKTELEERNAIINEILADIHIYTDRKENRGKGIDEVGIRQKRRKITANKGLCKKSSLEQLRVSHGNESSSTSLSASIDEILFLFDGFGVSDEFYHELSMMHLSFPHSYLIKERRKMISSNVPIQRSPHSYIGCFWSLREHMAEILSEQDSDQ
uniref:Uncharacterized protein n=1 Tax=Amphimedon queenslandica TaxID=400682 RepID=A0A1X7VGH7_AMPQE